MEFASRCHHGPQRFSDRNKMPGSFEPSAKSTIYGRKPYNGAGIVLIADQMNHAGLQRGAFLENDHVRHYLNFEVRKDGKVVISCYAMDLKDQETWLRMERRGDKLTASVS